MLDKTPSKLKEIRDSCAAKILRVKPDLKAFRLFPDAKKKEIYDSLVEAGEIVEEPETATSLSPTNQEIVDAEFQSQLQFYIDKIARLEEFVILTKKDIELSK